MGLGLVKVRFKVRFKVSIGGRVRVSFFGSFRVRGGVRVRVRFWLGPGTQLDPKNLCSFITKRVKCLCSIGIHVIQRHAKIATVY